MKNYLIALLFMFSALPGSFAQDNTSAEDKHAVYIKMITQRAGKIVTALNIADTLKAVKVTNIIRDQYNDLNDIYEKRDGDIKDIKAKNDGDKAAIEEAVKKTNLKVDTRLDKQHKKYLSKLSKELSAEQIDQVKNGMTYNVLPITYKAYQEEILTLTEDQKKQILIWLTEAREHAIDAESADKKHAWFGKYKGRINNYLSAAGYDLKKEGAEWEKRRKAASNNSTK